ncbi:ensconsin-like [Drosophila guanche]|uniref:Uncharacterized protein n=2 Tax=Drosophila guanche TaxID=7266 RepID=A0A3B0KWS1_DROGU|nr:ensconsin-like [Drosophila guanche]XP_034138605.1 ensconsin-like [Drosophila guanche]SPP88487.1 Hypothetical predicted protein [Drosophila guanche]SPP88488.1 Hypothetical predicted protein [Drosophila guanche]SPP88501.1 Hypothetical predicted protein [Drosophila guanche]
MAFMSRRNPKGKLVQRKLLSGSPASGPGNPMPEWRDLSKSDEGLTDQILVAGIDTDSTESTKQKKDRQRQLNYDAWVQLKDKEKKQKILAERRESERLERANKERMEESHRMVGEWNLKKEQQIHEERHKKPFVIPQKYRATYVRCPRETPEERRERIQALARLNHIKAQRLARQREEQEKLQERR